MKILQINKFFFLKGGAERYFFDLAELLSQKGHQIIIWSTSHPQNFSWPGQESFAQFNDFSIKENLLKELKKGIEIFWNKAAQRKLEKLIQQEKPDIIHLHNVFTHFPLSIFSLFKKYNLPVVMTLHDYKLFCPNYRFFTQGEACFDCLEKKNYRSCLVKKCIKNSRVKSLAGYLEAKWQKDFIKTAGKIDLFIAPSLFVKNKALEWGIKKEKIVHLPHFAEVAPSVFDQKPKSSRPYLLYFGRLSEEKGVDLLIRAMREVFNKFPNLRLKIVGDGPQKQNLENMVMGNYQIEFLGKKTGKDLQKLINESYLVVVPSLCPETFSLNTLESFTLAKPVIGAKIGAIPELIKDKETGLLFKLKNAKNLEQKIIWAINHPKQVIQLGENAREEVVKKYNTKKHYQGIIKIYERIAHN